MYFQIIHTLEELQEVINNETSQKAHQFLATRIPINNNTSDPITYCH